MAGRPPKENITFAGWEVDIFDNEPKIDKLLDAQGCVGFVVYFYLCQKAYGSNGYFYSWSYDDAATTARKIGGGAGSRAVSNTVSLCLRIGLFDKNLYERHKILTSRGIQKRFSLVAKTRSGNSVIKEYWLLNEEESAGLNFRTLNLNYAPSKLNYDPPKLNYDTPQYSKVNNTLSFEPPAADPERDDLLTAPDADKPKGIARKKPLYEHDSPYYKAAQWLAKAIYKRVPGYKPVTESELQRWANEARLMVEYDKREINTINKLLVFSQNDSFWQNNILSMGKFRKQFDQLAIRHEESKRKTGTETAPLDTGYPQLADFIESEGANGKHHKNSAV